MFHHHTGMFDYQMEHMQKLQHGAYPGALAPPPAVTLTKGPVQEQIWAEAAAASERRDLSRSRSRPRSRPGSRPGSRNPTPVRPRPVVPPSQVGIVGHDVAARWREIATDIPPRPTALGPFDVTFG